MSAGTFVSALCLLMISDVSWETPSLLTVGSSGYPVDFELKNARFHRNRYHWSKNEKYKLLV